jgi:hypothetical protein
MQHRRRADRGGHHADNRHDPLSGVLSGSVRLITFDAKFRRRPSARQVGKNR